MRKKIKQNWSVLLVGCLLLAYGAYRFANSPPRPPMVGQGPLQGSSLATVTVLDVGQGDAILIRSPEGKTALVDAGPSHLVVEALREQGVTALDLVVVSHHHADHYGGMAAVIKAFAPRVFLATGSSHTTAHYLKLLELVRDRRMQAIEPGGSPRKVALGSVELTVFPQAPEDPKEENNNSIGLRLQFGNFSVLLAGDAERPERTWWEGAVPSLCAEASVLKLAHHGSRNGTDARWLALVRPQLAVASLGAGNEYGHPHPETLALLAEEKIPLLRTDRDGAIVIQSDGRQWQVVGHPALRPPGLTRDGVRAGPAGGARSSTDRAGPVPVPLRQSEPSSLSRPVPGGSGPTPGASRKAMIPCSSKDGRCGRARVRVISKDPREFGLGPDEVSRVPLVACPPVALAGRPRGRHRDPDLRA